MSPSILLERDPILEEIESAIARTRSGSSGVLVVSAPAGMGKTRLLAEVRTLVTGMRVLSGRGTQLEREYGYGLVRQIFEPLLADPELDRDSLMAGAAGAASFVLGQSSAPPTQGDVAVRHGLFWLTSNLCLTGPLVLILDDLHWADEPSLRFLTYLAHRIEDLPLLIVAGMRPGAEGVAGRLLAMLTSVPDVRFTELRPLSQEGVSRLLAAALDADPHPAFALACATATRGNPLYLTELARAVAAEGLTPSPDNAPAAQRIGSQAVARRVWLELHGLAPEPVELAQAIAVLGERAPLAVAAKLTGLDSAASMAGVDALVKACLIEIGQPLPEGSALDFVHPLVRTAVYEQIGLDRRNALHTRAIELLAESHAPAEKLAPHYLAVPPGVAPNAAATLRQAAEDALVRGAPESGFAYLRRCLAETHSPAERADLLINLGGLATWVDMDAAAGYLAEAYASIQGQPDKARVGAMLGSVLLYAHRMDEAIQVLAEAESALPDTEVDLKRRIQANIFNLLIVEPQRQAEADKRRALWEAEPSSTVGGLLLDCSLAFHDMKVCRPEAVERARRGMADGVLIREATGEAPLVSGWVVLLAADEDEIMGVLDEAVAQGRQRGATRDLAPAYAFRALGWLWRGYLAEAEEDAREACRAIDEAGVDLGRPWTAPYLAYALAEQGRLDEAEEALAWARVPDPVPSWGAFYLVLEARAQFLRLRRREEEALAAALLCGEFAESARVLNPALLAWRSEAALSLLNLGRKEESRELAAEEVRLAEQWGAPRALGRALRVRGLAEGGDLGLDLLRRSVAVLEGSPARLEHARSLVELGAALRRAGSRGEAVRHLTAGLELAYMCKAVPLTERARTELHASGVRPRRARQTGPAALTPSELRVAELAMDGLTNRDIAQRLFVTAKTVEVHLSAAYRKLGVSSRSQLRPALAGGA